MSWGYLTIIRFPFFCLFTLPVLSLLPLVCLFIYFCWVSFFAFSFLSPHLFHLHLLPCIRLLCFHSIISLNFTAPLFPFHLTIFLLFLLFNLDFFFCSLPIYHSIFFSVKIYRELCIIQLANIRRGITEEKANWKREKMLLRVPRGDRHQFWFQYWIISHSFTLESILWCVWWHQEGRICKIKLR